MRHKLVVMDLSKKLPIPEFLKSSNSENEQKHYERGKWATFIFIPLSLKLSEINGILKSFANGFQHLSLNVINIDDLHISLTKTVTLRHHWIDSFMKSIENQVRICKGFNIFFDMWKVYVNEDNSKTFIALKVADNTQLLTLLAKLEDSLAEFNLPFFYKDPSFHMSILWTHGNEVDVMLKHGKELDLLFGRIVSFISNENMRFDINSVVCKCGNKLFEFNF